jgi:hypothetical protein
MSSTEKKFVGSKKATAFVFGILAVVGTGYLFQANIEMVKVMLSPVTTIVIGYLITQGVIDAKILETLATMIMGKKAINGTEEPK